MKYGIDKTYTANQDGTNETFKHNGKTGVFAIGVNSGSGTVKLQHQIGTKFVTIDSLAADGGTQFVSPMGTLRIVTESFSSGNISVVVRPLNEH